MTIIIFVVSPSDTSVSQCCHSSATHYISHFSQWIYRSQTI